MAFLRERLSLAWPTRSSRLASSASSSAMRSPAWVMASSCWRACLGEGQHSRDAFAILAFEALEQVQAFFHLVQAARVELDAFQVVAQIASELFQALEQRLRLLPPGQPGSGRGAPRLPRALTVCPNRSVAAGDLGMPFIQQQDGLLRQRGQALRRWPGGCARRAVLLPRRAAGGRLRSR